MKRIRLENFRCFELQEIEFKDKLNVLIGDNASGKTSVLNACKYVLSSFFAGFSDDNTRWISPSNHDFRTIVNEEGMLLPERPIQIDFELQRQLIELLDIDRESLFDCGFSLQKNSRKNSRALISGIKEFKQATQVLQENLYGKDNKRKLPLPVFSFFSTEDIHRARKVNQKKFLSYTQKPSFGYYECLEGNGLFDFWLKRLLALQEGQKKQQEIDIVRNAVVNALGHNGCEIIEDILVRPIQKKVFFKYIDGREVEAAFLSDGYKRLVYIVMDIAFRCALLNGEVYGDNTAKESFGTVLIDELDMHLHPALQARILKGLSNAFPNIQFIVTTHAPMIMSSLPSSEENTIVKLDYAKEIGYTVGYANLYGKDASNIIETVLNQPPRDMNIDNKLDELFELIDTDKIEQAKVALANLRSEFGIDLPEFYKAETMIEFLEPSEDD